MAIEKNAGYIIKCDWCGQRFLEGEDKSCATYKTKKAALEALKDYNSWDVVPVKDRWAIIKNGKKIMCETCKQKEKL